MVFKSRESTRRGKIDLKKEQQGSDGNKLKPKFSLEHLGGQYCLSKCTHEEKISLIDKLHTLSKLTWNEIIQSPRHGLGYEFINFSQLSGVSNTFKDKKIISFRFCRKAPMIGYREKEIFYILALDRDFTCYPH